MSKSKSNRFEEMEVFLRVVECGGFTAAAHVTNKTPSAVSKMMMRLETRLGVRLINRSTRQLKLTEEGQSFYERSTRILADMEDAECAVRSRKSPVGRVCINTSASYANHILAPLLPDFLSKYPAITLDIVQTDRIIDLLAERTDVAIRAGSLKSSSLVARKLGETSLTVVASPSYVARFGTPQTIEELKTHNLLGLGYNRNVNGWELHENGKIIAVATTGCVHVSNGEGLRHLALAGVGLARLANFSVRNDIAAGRLLPLMEHFNEGEKESFHAVYVGHGGPLPPRVRVLLDFIAKHGRID